MASKYKYPLKPKIQFYPDELTLAKFKKMAKQDGRSQSGLANHIIYQAVKDVKLEEGK